MWIGSRTYGLVAALTFGIAMAAPPAAAQEAFSEAFCRDLKRVVVAVEKGKLGPFKGKALSKTKWRAREDLFGMNECEIEDFGPPKDLESALFGEISFQCVATMTHDDISMDPKSEMALKTRAQADARFVQYERAIQACFAGMPVDREVGTGLARGMPRLQFRKSKGLRIELRMARGFKKVHIRLNVAAGS